MPTTAYHSYLLRLWRVHNDGDQWRILLESVASGERHAFTTFAALLSYLQALEDDSPPGSTPPPLPPTEAPNA